MYIPRRGDIVWVDFDPQAGHEQANVRPESGILTLTLINILHWRLYGTCKNRCYWLWCHRK